MEYYGIQVHNLEDYRTHRAETIKDKDLAIMLQFVELDKIINASKFSKRFFNKSHSWFAQRVNNYAVNGEKAFFTNAEFETLANGFRELARQLNQYADELDNGDRFDGRE